MAYKTKKRNMSYISVEGRFHDSRPSAPQVADVHRDEDGTFTFRVEDTKNPGCWLKIHIHPDK